MNKGVVFHVDEMRKWGLALGNVQNLMQALDGADMIVEVLANSEAVTLYANSESQPERQIMRQLSEKGVQFMACNNALRKLNIPKDQLPSFVSVVPAGVLELVEKQQQGYAYIKP
ncbi:MAG: DsrE family protein [Eubacteriales bacterium]|nr:DsrE family protein [Eubacteriales bacterium]